MHGDTIKLHSACAVRKYTRAEIISQSRKLQYDNGTLCNIYHRSLSDDSADAAMPICRSSEHVHVVRFQVTVGPYRRLLRGCSADAGVTTFAGIRDFAASEAMSSLGISRAVRRVPTVQELEAAAVHVQVSAACL